MYLIDGYNLLYSTDIETKEELISTLNKYFIYRKKTARVVFDGFDDFDLSTNSVQVEYAGDADERIAEILKECDNPSYYVLVTSDKELRFIARQKKVKIIRSEEFNFLMPTVKAVESGEETDFFLTDSEVQAQLKEFNNFKKD